MRTAWISSVIFSFVAVLGVGGFSFFLISGKSQNSEPTIALQDAELADSEVFASAILPDLKERSSDSVLSRDNKSSQSNDDYEILEADDVSISALIADTSVSKTANDMSSSPVDKSLRLSLRKQNTGKGRLSLRGAKADESELSRRIVAKVDDFYDAPSDTVTDSLTKTNTTDAADITTSRLGSSRFKTRSVKTQANSFEDKFNDIPAEMEPETIDGSDVTSSSDIDALVAINKFNARNNFQPETRRKSFDNLLDQDDNFEQLDTREDVKRDDVKEDYVNEGTAGVSNMSVGLLESRPSSIESVREDVIAIIVHRENSENISISDVKNIYVDKRMNWGNGGKIITYNLPIDSNGREVFSQSVLDMSAIQAATEASNRVITNAAYNRSHTKRDRLVISYVSRNPRAIGYVPLKAAKQSSKVRIILTMKP